MTTITWDPVTTNCDGSLATDLAAYEVKASYEASAMVMVAMVPSSTLMAEIDLDPAPGQVLFVRVHAVDWAGNSSEAGCP